MSRAEVVLAIVRTDATFSLKTLVDDHGRARDAFWTGKCIHCNTGMVVAMDGSTGATIEHIRRAVVATTTRASGTTCTQGRVDGPMK